MTSFSSPFLPASRALSGMEAGPQAEWGFTDYASDVAYAVPRGLLGGVSDIVNVFGLPFGEQLVEDRFGLMDSSQSFAGSMVEGVSSFATGFIPGLGIAGKLGKVSGLTKAVASAATKYDDAARLAKFAGQGWKNARYVAQAKAFRGAAAFGKETVAGAIADFVSFDGHEERLSNLINTYAPELKNPLTEWLAADPNDGEIEGRFKNAIEGMFVGSMTEGVYRAFRVYKSGLIAKNAGQDADMAMAREYGKLRVEQREKLKKAFNTTDAQAELLSTAVDAGGVDRRLLDIVEDPEVARQKLREQIEASKDPALYMLAYTQPSQADLAAMATNLEAGGFSWSPHQARFLDQATGGFAVSTEKGRELVSDTPFTSQQIGEYAARNRDLLEGNPNLVVGGWKNVDDQGNAKYYLDVSSVVGDRDLAEQLAVENNQLAIWDLGSMSGINAADYRLRFTGAVEAKRGRLSKKVNDLLPDDLVAHTPAEELAKLNVAHAASYREKWESLADPEYLASLARFAQVGSRWYQVTDSVVRALTSTRPEDHWIINGLLSTTSPRQKVQVSVGMAGRIYRKFVEARAKAKAAGRELTEKEITDLVLSEDKLESRTNNTIKLLSSKTEEEAIQRLTGIKITNFSKATAGDPWVVVNDTIQARAFGEDDGPAGLMYRAMSARTSQAASLAGMKPGQGQAAIWGIARFINDKIKGMNKLKDPPRGRTLMDIDLKDVDVYQPDDIAHIFADTGRTSGEYLEPWKGLGLDLDGAREAFHRFAAENPDFIPTGREIGNLREGAGPEAAEKLIRNVLESQRRSNIGKYKAQRRLADRLRKMADDPKLKLDELRELLENQQLPPELADNLPALRDTADKLRTEAEYGLENPQRILFQTPDNQRIRGFALREGSRVMIAGVTNPDFTTGIHEIGHAIRLMVLDPSVPAHVRGISDDQMQRLARWSGAENGWTRAAEERFVSGLLRYIYDGRYPKGMRDSFQGATNWMRAFYRDLKNSDIDVPISPEMRNVFDAVLSNGPGIKNHIKGGSAVQRMVESGPLFQTDADEYGRSGDMPIHKLASAARSMGTPVPTDAKGWLDVLKKTNDPYAPLAKEIAESADADSLSIPVVVSQDSNFRAIYADDLNTLAAKDSRNVGNAKLPNWYRKKAKKEPTKDAPGIVVGRGSNTGTLVHEVIHGTTAQKIKQAVTVVPQGTLLDFEKGKSYLKLADKITKDTAVDPAVRRLFKGYLKAIDAAGLRKRLSQFPMAGNPDYVQEDNMPYGLGDIFEFISEAMSRKEFQDFLKTVPVEGRRTLWTDFLSSMQALLGLKSNKKASNLLEQVISDTNSISTVPAEQFLGQSWKGVADPVYGTRGKDPDARKSELLFQMDDPRFRMDPTIPGAGKPGGEPEASLNLGRTSTSREAAEMIAKEVEDYVANATEQEPVTFSAAVDDAVNVAREYSGSLGLDPRQLETDLLNSQYGEAGIRQARNELMALRFVLSRLGEEMASIAGRGRNGGAGDADRYAFLLARSRAQVVGVQVKNRAREFARGLRFMSAVPAPLEINSRVPEMPPVTEAARPGPTAAPAPAMAEGVPGAGMAPEGVPGTGMAPEGVPGAGMAPEGVPGAGMAPEGVPGAGMAPEGVPGAGMAPEGVPGAGVAPEGAAAPEGIAAPAALDVPDVAGMTAAERDAAMQQIIEEHGGRAAVDRMMRDAAIAFETGGAGRMFDCIEGQRHGNVWIEYWMNSILSGPVTHAVNITANAMTGIYLPLERMLGASLRGDFQTAQLAATQIGYTFSEAVEAFRLARLAFTLDQNLLDQVGTREVVQRGFTGGGFRQDAVLRYVAPEENSTGEAAINWIGRNVVNVPSRLLASEDEFFKQVSYRARLKADLYGQGLQRFGGDARAAAQWVEDTFEQQIRSGAAYSEAEVLRRAANAAQAEIAAGRLAPGGMEQFVRNYMANRQNWDPELGRASQRAFEYSRQSTFSQPLATGSGNPLISVSAHLSNAVNQWPALRFVLPFIRTPTNLLNFALQRTLPVSAYEARRLFRETAQQTSQRAADARSEAIGRIAFSGMFMTVAGIAAFSGNITGGGPKNKAEREALMAVGWQPYSIRVGETYYSYRRQDPFSTILGMIADTVEGYRYAESKDIPALDAAASVITMTIGRNIANKTYLTGITNIANALSNPEQFGQTLVNNYVGSMVPFSGALGQSKATVANDGVLREVRTMLDAVYNKIPGLAEKLPPKRNLLGEPVLKAEGFLLPDMVSPVTWTQLKDDRILNEFALLGHGFTPPKETRGQIDLTAMNMPNGQMAYDRWLELHGQVKIGGRTLRQSLLKLINTRSYQALSPESSEDYDSPRVRALRGVLSQYREAAYRQLLKESPELRGAEQIDQENRRALRQGRAPKELKDLVR